MRTTISHEFVDAIPDQLEEGVVYVSLEYATAVHLCCCGCGHQVVTPLHPRQWALIFDGETLSLHPSIGNWSFPCRSHYWIKSGRVRVAYSFTRTEVGDLRATQAAELDDHFEERQGAETTLERNPVAIGRGGLRSWIRRMLRLLSRR